MAQDPMLVLPSELMRRIFLVYPKQIIALRRVSKAYNAFLQDDSLIRQVIEFYDTHDPADAAPRTETARFTALKSHTTGKPAGHFTLRGRWGEIESSVLSGKRLAFFSGPRQLSVVDLQTEKCVTRQMGSTQRDTLVMTDQVVAYLDTGGAHYLRLDNLSGAITGVDCPAGKAVTELAAYANHLAVLYGDPESVSILDTITGRVVMEVHLNDDNDDYDDDDNDYYSNYDEKCWSLGLLMRPNYCFLVHAKDDDSCCPGMLSPNLRSLSLHLKDWQVIHRRYASLWNQHCDRVSLLPTGLGEWDVFGKESDGDMYGVVTKDFKLKFSMEKICTRWKGVSHLGTADSIVVPGKGVLHGRRAEGRARLLINDSYLIDTVGDRFEVFSFDGQGKEVPETPSECYWWSKEQALPIREHVP